MTARRIIVHGRVQGVFYRDWSVATARSLGLAGWVRNLPDGTVEAHLEGDQAAIERMIEEMQAGPPRAEPTGIDVQIVDSQSLSGFTRCNWKSDR